MEIGQFLHFDASLDATDYGDYRDIKYYYEKSMCVFYGPFENPESNPDVRMSMMAFARSHAQSANDISWKCPQSVITSV